MTGIATLTPDYSDDVIIRGRSLYNRAKQRNSSRFVKFRETYKGRRIAKSYRDIEKGLRKRVLHKTAEGIEVIDLYRLKVL